MNDHDNGTSIDSEPYRSPKDLEGSSAIKTPAKPGLVWLVIGLTLVGTGAATAYFFTPGVSDFGNTNRRPVREIEDYGFYSRSPPPEEELIEPDSAPQQTVEP